MDIADKVKPVDLELTALKMCILLHRATKEISTSPFPVFQLRKGGFCFFCQLQIHQCPVNLLWVVYFYSLIQHSHEHGLRARHLAMNALVGKGAWYVPWGAHSQSEKGQQQICGVRATVRVGTLSSTQRLCWGNIWAMFCTVSRRKSKIGTLSWAMHEHHTEVGRKVVLVEERSSKRKGREVGGGLNPWAEPQNILWNSFLHLVPL